MKIVVNDYSQLRKELATWVSTPGVQLLFRELDNNEIEVKLVTSENERVIRFVEKKRKSRIHWILDEQVKDLLKYKITGISIIRKDNHGYKYREVMGEFLTSTNHFVAKQCVDSNALYNLRTFKTREVAKKAFTR